VEAANAQKLMERTAGGFNTVKIVPLVRSSREMQTNRRGIFLSQDVTVATTSPSTLFDVIVIVIRVEKIQPTHISKGLFITMK